MNIRYVWPAIAGVIRLRQWKAGTTKPLDIGRNYGLPDNPKFMSPVQAARLINSEDVLAVTGLAATGWTPVMVEAVATRRHEIKDLILMAVGGCGGRGKIKGSWDDLALYPGLVESFFSGHLETFRHILTAADKGLIKVNLIPQGAFSQLLYGMSRGGVPFRTQAGIGTYVDPKVGIGTIIANTDKQWVKKVEGYLEYYCPWPTVAIINATSVDKDGNVYFDNSALLGEVKTLVMAVKERGGKVIVQCGFVRKVYDPEKIYIRGEMVDAIVVDPKTPQTLCWTQLEPNLALVAGAKANVARALAVIRMINQVAKLTPKRGSVDREIAWKAKEIVAGLIKNRTMSASVNVGVGLPEEVAAELARAGLLGRLEMIVESGPSGGTPTAGATFGCMINPVSMIESPAVFAQIERGIDIAILGALEIDSEGNVNLSRKGPGVLGTVGTGGSTTIMHGARAIVFVMRSHDNKTGASRFVDKVQEVTFSAKQALAAGQQVYYVTDVGVFSPTDDGLKLAWLASSVTLADVKAIVPSAIA